MTGQAEQTQAEQIRVPLPRVGFEVTPLNAAEVVARISRGTGGRSRIIANLNLHALYMTYRDPAFHRFCAEADLLLIDGWPILMLARLSKRNLHGSTRIGSSDWLEELLQSHTGPLTITAVGGTPLSARRALERAEAMNPSIAWHAFDGFEFAHQGSSGGRGRTLDNALESADLVIVGMGMPHQERWITENRKYISSAYKIGRAHV